MDNSVIARSGWLLKKVSGKDWRKNWIELYRDGYLKYYENDYSPNPEDVINMPTECISVKTGLQVEESYSPPTGHSSQCVFSISASGNKKWILCADTPDDMRAWQLALEQARLLISRQPHHHAHHHPALHHPAHHHPHHHHQHQQQQQHAHHQQIHHNLNHPSILHNMRLAEIPGTTLPLEDYLRLNQYTQLQYMINSRNLPLEFDPRTTTYPHLHLPPPPPPLPPSSTSTSSSSSTRSSNISEPVNSTTMTKQPTSTAPQCQPSTTTSIFPIPVSPLTAPHHPHPHPHHHHHHHHPPPTQATVSPRPPCFNFNFSNPESPLRPGPLYPSISQSTSLPTTPLTSQSRIFPSLFPEPDIRNFNIDVLAGSTSSPDARFGTNRLVWPPFIWW